MLNKLKSKSFWLTAFNWLAAQLLVATLILVIVVGTVITTTTGRNWIVNQSLNWLNSSSILQDQNLNIELTNFNSPEANHITFDELILYKQESVWVRIKKFDLIVALKPLWLKRIYIENFSAASVYYQQLPIEPAEPEPKDNEKKPLELPFVKIDAIKIDELIIDQALPEALLPPFANDNRLRYSVTGNGQFSPSSGLALNLDAQSMIDRLASITVKTTSQSMFQSVIEANINEPAKGWLGYWLKLPEAQAIAAEIEVGVQQVEDRFEFDIKQLAMPLGDHAIGLRGNLEFQPTVPTASDNTWALTVANTELQIDDSKHTISGNITYPQIEANVVLNRFPVDIVNPWLPELTAGFIDADLKLSESIEDIHFAGNLNALLTYAAKQFSLNVDANGDLNQVDIAKFNAKFADATADASGKLDLKGDGNNLNFKAANLSTDTLKPFSIPIPDNLYAKVATANGQLKGAITNPRGEANLIANGKYLDQPFDLHGDIAAQGENIVIQDVVITLPEGSSHVKGDVNWKTIEGNIDAHLEQLPLTLLSLVGVELPETLTAKLTGDLNAKGNLAQPDAIGTLNLVGQYEEIPFSVGANATYQGELATLSKLVVNAYDETVLTANGSYRAENFDFQLRIDELPLKLLNAFDIGIPEGEFSANLNADGSIATPNLNGDIHYATVLKGYSQSGERENINLKIDTTLKTIEDILSVNANIRKNQDDPGKIAVTIPFHEYLKELTGAAEDRSDSLALDTKLDADLDLQLVSFLLDPDINQLYGTFRANLVAAGSLHKPKVTGSINIEDTNYLNSLTGTRIDNLNCRVNAQNQLFSFVDCAATDGNSGKYQMIGDIRLPSKTLPEEVDVTLKTRKANILKRPDIESEATGEISVVGDFKKLLAKGELEVSPFNAIIDINTGANPPELDVREVYDEEESNQEQQASSAAPEIEFDLKITATQQAYLRGRGLDAELSGDILLKGTASDPQYSGEFNVLRGDFEVFGKKFNLEQGQVNFINNAIAIAVRGVYEKKGNEIIAEITGQNDDFKIKLSSIPSMPQDEILSFIIFGESAQEIDPIKAIQLAQAVKKLQGGGSSFDLIGSARDLLGVDSLTIDNEEETEDSAGGINVGVGKYLNDRTYLELERTPDPSEPWKGTIEIELTPRIHLQSSTGGTSGIDSAEIIWEKDY